jgi:hypothetical protein
MQQVIADLYFTLPFDLAIIDATVKYWSEGDLPAGRSEEYGKIFMGEPWAADSEACEATGVKADYLHYIAGGQLELDAREHDQPLAP